jgi:predicted Fe-Mo cluster-binding NifX family protein
MLIAVPNCQGHVSPVFDVAARLVLVRIRGNAEAERREVVLHDKHSEGIVRTLRELGARIVICGAISQGLQVGLEHAGIRVVPQVCGGLDRVIDAFRGGTLAQPEFAMPGCCGWRKKALLQRRCGRKGPNALRMRALERLRG